MSDTPDGFLDSGFCCEARDGLQQELRDRTTRVLRRRRRLKRAGQAGLLAVFFLAGMATMYVFRQDAQEKPAAPVAHGTPRTPQEVQVAELPPTAAVLELRAQQSTDQRAQQLRRAADKYLQEEKDFAAALRCYSQALDDGALDSSPDDTWLETALKYARRKENSHAN
jgi:hypothetical protein